jgi:catalase
MHHYHKDGSMRFFENDSGNPDAYYEPNSLPSPKQDKKYAEPPLPLSGDADRYDHRLGNDDFAQPGNLFRLFDAAQKERLFENIAAAMQGVPEAIQRRQIALFAKCDPAYGAGVARELKLEPVDPLRGTSATDAPKEANAA